MTEQPFNPLDIVPEKYRQTVLESIDTFPQDIKFPKLGEESSELATSIYQFMNKNGSTGPILEEIAGVLICCSEALCSFYTRDEIDKAFEIQINKLKRHIETEQVRQERMLHDR